MELRHLRYFVAVAEEQELHPRRRAAVDRAAGPVTADPGLERELGVTLFERLNRGVMLTDAGGLFLDQARLVLKAADAALAVGRGAGAGLIGNLRLGLGTQARSDVWPTVIAAFAGRRPRVEVTVMEAQSDTLLRDLRDGRLDAAIVLGPVAQPAMRSVALHQAPVRVAMDPRHRLARLDRLTPDDLDGQVVAVCGTRDGATYDGFVGGVLESFGVRHHLRPSGYGPAMLAPVRSGTAIALLPASDGAEAPGLAVRLLDAAPAFCFDLAWPEARTTAVVDVFVETCTTALADRRGARLGPRLVPSAEQTLAA